MMLILSVVVCFCLGMLWWALKQLRKMREQMQDIRLENQRLTEVVDLDDLTIAKSRRFLAETLDETNRTDDHGILFIDLDDFKTVNDGYGHEAGDALLVEIAKNLVNACRPKDFVSRLGGDEFCVFLHNCNLEQATQAGERFREAVAKAKVVVDGIPVRRTASIGATVMAADQSLVDALLVADAAVYEAKSRGRNLVASTDMEVLRKLTERQTKTTVEDLSQALADGQVQYFVQPIFDLNTSKAVGVEGLIRWVKPDGSVLGPDQFLNIMTSNYGVNLRPPIDAANKVASTFIDMNPEMFCAWNISSSFLSRTVETSSDWVEQLLAGLNPHNTVFEIVESAVIANPDRTRRLLHGLRDAGVRVALDDFGTGLSNLERLVEYPIDIVKIDRSFVSHVGSGGNTAILKGLVAMRDSMGFEIIAEGVETEAQRDALFDLGITKAQGFLLGRPQSVEYWAKHLSSRL